MSRTRDDLLSDLDLLGFEREVRFRGLSGKRQWRWDSAFVTPDGRTIAVEYQGYSIDHTSRKGTSRDYAKTNEGQLCGITVIQCNSESVNDGRCWSWIMLALGDEA